MPTDPAADPDLTRILDFLRGIGIAVSIGEVADGFLPGIAIRRGGIFYDPARLTWPGDLLHEAGHIAVTEPALRPTLDAVPDQPGEEMATIAWSYAAALACGYDTAKVFHAGGYRGGGGWIADVFAQGGTLGQPLLQWYGMTIDARTAETTGGTPYPHMIRWLR
ncbi:MAG: hypothetical protein V4537_01530 [Pseudomonadota bacterium]